MVKHVVPMSFDDVQALDNEDLILIRKLAAKGRKKTFIMFRRVVVLGLVICTLMSKCWMWQD